MHVIDFHWSYHAKEYKFVHVHVLKFNISLPNTALKRIQTGKWLASKTLRSAVSQKIKSPQRKKPRDQLVYKMTHTIMHITCVLAHRIQETSHLHSM